MRIPPLVSIVFLLLGAPLGTCLQPPFQPSNSRPSPWLSKGRLPLTTIPQASEYEASVPSLATRRTILTSTAALFPLVSVTSVLPRSSFAMDQGTASAQVTDRIYLTVQGLPTQDGSSSNSNSSRIVIGLFGKDSPRSVATLKQLVSQQGLPLVCRPKAERVLQKEQLEANKVYKACKQAEQQGVVLRDSTIWRVVKDELVSFGAVTGKFLAREYPDWDEDPSTSDGSRLRHDAFGVVSVLRGAEGGFGFSIYTGNGGDDAAADMDREYLVVGRVLEGMDVLERLNQVPVITTARSVNYMALTGTTATGKAPTRSCRYGGPMYCNEYKPLIKLSISDTGVL